MTMDAVTIETLPTTKSLLSTKVPESTDIAKEKDDDILYVDEIDEDDEIRLRLSDDEEIEQENTLGDTENQQANLQLNKNGKKQKLIALNKLSYLNSAIYL
jgi:hypothetical protein